MTYVINIPKAIIHTNKDGDSGIVKVMNVKSTIPPCGIFGFSGSLPGSVIEALTKATRQNMAMP